MNITVNQNRQLYVANAYNATVNDSSAVGTIGGVKVVDSGLGKEMYFLYKGADTVLKSDRIQLQNLSYAKAVAAADMVVPLKKVKIALDTNVNGGNVVVGQDYELRIHLIGFYTDSEIEDYNKFGIVHATSAMAANPALLYQEMVNSLNRNFSREVGATATSNPYLAFTSDANGIYIQEKEQSWTLGIEQQRSVNFSVYPQQIYTNGNDEIWGVVTDLTPDKASATVGVDALGNGKKIADLEYFCMGERGDQYRNMGWPNVIATQYLVDPSKEYNTLELHFAFTDTGVNSYRSEKDITIVAEDVAELNKLITAINSAANLSIATL